MTLGRLVWANLLRNKRRNILTIGSVAMALFLFAALRSVLTTLDDAVKVGSESRLVTMSATSIVFPLPQSYYPRIQAVDGVSGVTWASWFGGQYQKPENFFGQFAIDAETYLSLYPEIQIPPEQLEAFKQERTAAIVGRRLMEKFGWQLGQTITLQGTIFPGDWDFTIRAVYVPTNPSLGEETMLFHYEYLYEKSGRQASPGWYVMTLSDPSRAATISQQIDDMFRSSPAPTKTGTERAFQASFITMWGNIAFLVRAIGTAVFFAILLVAANAMMMSARERTSDIAVLKTLGFGGTLIFGLVIAEALVITLTGGVVGLGLGKTLLDSFKAMDSFLPGFSVKGSTIAQGLAIATTLGLLAGLVPAWQAMRLSVIAALRRLA